MAGTSVSVEARTARSREQVTGEFKVAPSVELAIKHGAMTLSCQPSARAQKESPDRTMRRSHVRALGRPLNPEARYLSPSEICLRLVSVLRARSLICALRSTHCLASGGTS